MIALEHVTKTYKIDFWAKKFYALKDVSFTVTPGSLTGFLGANGAGKTTSLKMIMDFIYKDAGDISFHKMLGKNKKEIFSNIGYLPERPYFYQSLTGLEFLTYMARLNGLTFQRINEQIKKWTTMFNIYYAVDRKIKGYSKGMLQRLGMASVMLHEPKFIILDEPLSGLDPVGRKEIKDVLVNLNHDGRTIFFSTHIVSDVEEICHDVVALEKGVCIYSGAVQQLVERASEDEWEIVYRSQSELFKTIVARKDKEDFIENKIKEGCKIISVSAKKQTLENIIYNVNVVKELASP